MAMHIKRRPDNIIAPYTIYFDLHTGIIYLLLVCSRQNIILLYTLVDINGRRDQRITCINAIQ